MYTNQAIVRNFAVTTSESRLLKTTSENFVGHGLQKSGGGISKLKNNLVGAVRWRTFDVPNNIQLLLLV